ncbi:hypothetical protein SAMN05421678_118126 [Actinopolymorpha cephalotaxi]|uniref:Uncharacterized protein n=1 Tax=Actinopolymorpha cephalotaxi TaxID=504797 RepID=A0A1I3ABY9_9ACTN|nr:hypothetical protein [Actinopolymorpha cephalotaxi]NYH85259.1 hypothetical protein [Actinopolymorpha cephalotaxi]SFH46831.1 hypothetical protein SAMN05421678_118126 [Actinopolymorpha cephalotaxi]
MGQVRFRRFDVVPRPKARSIRADDITLRSEDLLEVSLAATIRNNALAVPYGGHKLMRLVTRELALVLSLFERDRVGEPLTRHAAFADSSSHIRRFTTEVVALGALAAAVDKVHGATRGIAHLDALPADLQSLYAGGGRRIRPEFRFALPARVVAGECHGRDAREPQRALVAALERKRLGELLTWSRAQRTDQLCMAWTWVQSAGTTVDLFSFPSPGPAPSSPRRLAELRRALTAHPAELFEGSPSLSQEVAVRAGEAGLRGILLERFTGEVERQYLQTAPGPVPGLGEPWHGEWVDVPSPYGDALSARMLFAVSEAGSRNWRTEEVRPRIARAAADEALDIDADGRTLVAIDWRPRDPHEAGERIRVVLDN